MKQIQKMFFVSLVLFLFVGCQMGVEEHAALGKSDHYYFTQDGIWTTMNRIPKTAERPKNGLSLQRVQDPYQVVKPTEWNIKQITLPGKHSFRKQIQLTNKGYNAYSVVVNYPILHSCLVKLSVKNTSKDMETWKTFLSRLQIGEIGYHGNSMPKRLLSAKNFRYDPKTKAVYFLSSTHSFYQTTVGIYAKKGKALKSVVKEVFGQHAGELQVSMEQDGNYSCSSCNIGRNGIKTADQVRDCVFKKAFPK